MRERQEVQALPRRELTALALPPDRQVLGEGQFSIAVLVGSTKVVRMPRHELGVDQLRHERRVLEAVLGRVRAVLPVPLEAELDRAPGKAFAAHRLVPGDVLTRATLAGAAPHETEAIVAQVGQLLTDFAAATPAADAAGVPERPLAEVAELLARDVDRLLAARMSSTQATKARRSLAALSGADRGERSFCHADLGGNLVWDHARHRLGVIDFGDACVSDPVLDLASLAALDVELATAVAEQRPVLKGRMGDADAVRATFVLQDALSGARQGDWAHVEEILADY